MFKNIYSLSDTIFQQVYREGKKEQSKRYRTLHNTVNPGLFSCLLRHLARKWGGPILQVI